MPDIKAAEAAAAAEAADADGGGGTTATLLLDDEPPDRPESLPPLPEGRDLDGTEDAPPPRKPPDEGFDDDDDERPPLPRGAVDEPAPELLPAGALVELDVVLLIVVLDKQHHYCHYWRLCDGITATSAQER